MSTSPLAGKPAPPSLLIDPEVVVKAYYAEARAPVSFGTSGHRGAALSGGFNEAHILAITQAVCDERRAHGIDGPLFLGKDTHVLSGPAEATALEVLVANGVDVFVETSGRFTPTPAVSLAILRHNRDRSAHLADGIVVTPSHNPPDDGGFKYNPPHGGPADTDFTSGIEKRANALLSQGNVGVRRATAKSSPLVHLHDFATAYVEALADVVDLDAVRAAGVRIGVDPLGGAGVDYWPRVRERYRIDLTVIDATIDPRFGFMPVDHDGKIRMDCSSAFAMSTLVTVRDRFDVAFGNDPDADRHGIVTPEGLLAPNSYLAVAIAYLCGRRSGWPGGASVGKTVVSSSLIDFVVRRAGRQLFETPVGFKWFASGLQDGTLCFGGEESAGASLLACDGRVWTTDKDGLVLGLLAAEITARVQKHPAALAGELLSEAGPHHYVRVDAPCTDAERAAFKRLKLAPQELAGDEVLEIRTTAPANGASIGGIKVTTRGGWFAARPSGTESIYKLYAESTRTTQHLAQLVTDAQTCLSQAFESEPDSHEPDPHRG
jgi:phosphoglucomutase